MASSREIIEASPDLKKLFEEGFEISIRQVHLLVSSVPYVKADKTVARGTLIFPLELQSDVTAKKPADHTAHFAGEYPHYADGTPIRGMVAEEKEHKLADGIVRKIYFSSKPATADPDYHVKVHRYVDVLSEPARVIEPDADARTRRIVEVVDEDSPLVFLDTNSARAQIVPISDKLKRQRIAIVGLGGTGSYILDLVAKTPVKEVHLFDDDEYSLHNSYRCPGAPTAEQLRARKLKVEYLFETYRRVHKGIRPHPERVTAANVSKLEGMSYAFLCMDPGPDKAALVEYLVASRIPFTDTGIGIEAGADKLVGAVSTITVTPENATFRPCVPVMPPGDNDLYASNIQIAELNSLNAIFAVIRWKKHVGFYFNARNEHECTYDVGANMLRNDEAKP
jgi:molybdopterin/thiamine biosynthesis adenylyltransferase